MISFVFDTNCIISAHLLPVSMARSAYDKALEQGILLYSNETFGELSATFCRNKFDKYISGENRVKAISTFENKGYLVEVLSRINLCRDPKDNKFLELGVSGNANFIISGDKDLLVLHPFQNISIISPAEFVRNY